MATKTAAGADIPEGLDTFAPDTDMRKLGISLNPRLVVPVPNQAGRTTYKNGRSSDGNPISATNPAFVWRADAPAGQNLEVSIDGTNWSPYQTYKKAGGDVPLAAGWSVWSAVFPAPFWARQGDVLSLNMMVKYQSTSIPNLTLITTLPAEAVKGMKGQTLFAGLKHDGGTFWLNMNTDGRLVISEGAISAVWTSIQVSILIA